MTETPIIDTLQELYDATTHLQAVLNFTHTAEDLLRPELDYACRRLMAARSATRRIACIIEHRDDAALKHPELPPPFNRSNLRSLSAEEVLNG